ncbi:MAG: hypothetical protein VYD00_05610 [Pseudomonadota bacterium]|nr:hypothetical protein [Pseudomonadota bacterium]
MANGKKSMRIGLAISALLSALAILMLAETSAIERETAWVLAILPVSLIALAVFAGVRAGSDKPAASQRYMLRIGVLMAFYLVSLFAAEILIEDRGLTGAPAVILAVLPGLAFAGVVWVFGALIVEEKDEFMRLLHIRQGLIGTGIALTCAAIWGFLETYGFVPHVAAFWWPTIWCFGLGLGAFANKIAYGSWGEVR